MPVQAAFFFFSLQQSQQEMHYSVYMCVHVRVCACVCCISIRVNAAAQTTMRCRPRQLDSPLASHDKPAVVALHCCLQQRLVLLRTWRRERRRVSTAVFSLNVSSGALASVARGRGPAWRLHRVCCCCCCFFFFFGHLFVAVTGSIVASTTAPTVINRTTALIIAVVVVVVVVVACSGGWCSLCCLPPSTAPCSGMGDVSALSPPCGCGGSL